MDQSNLQSNSSTSMILYSICLYGRVKDRGADRSYPGDVVNQFFI